MRMGRPDPAELLRDNVFFDSCVYHQPGIDLLLEVTGTANVLFASEMLGAVRGADPDTGVDWDDTKTYVDRAGLTAQQQRQVFEGNARRVYPRLHARLTSEGR
jgi:4-oxalmesaconate hydratase